MGLLLARLLGVPPRPYPRASRVSRAGAAWPGQEDPEPGWAQPLVPPPHPLLLTLAV